MIAAAGIWAFMRGPLLGFLRGVPREVWYAIAAAVALALVWHWHTGQVEVAFNDGGAAQAEADGAVVAQATARAEAMQRQVIASTVAKQFTITKGTDDALVARNAQLVRDYADLRMRWAAYRADQRGASEGAAGAAANAASIAGDAACKAKGWVDIDTAAAAAEAADVATARDDAWRAWWVAQVAAWPQ